jgi:hypothetical protein
MTTHVLKIRVVLFSGLLMTIRERKIEVSGSLGGFSLAFMSQTKSCMVIRYIITILELMLIYQLICSHIGKGTLRIKECLPYS